MTLAFAALAVGFASGFGWSLMRSEPPEGVSRFSVVVPEEQAFRSGRETFDLSPDGSFIVYRGNADTGGPQLWMRRWDALDATPVPDGAVAGDPAISPDGREVAATHQGSLRVIPLEGGVSRTLTDDGAQCCPAWSPDGEWVYYMGGGNAVMRVAAEGGEPEALTEPEGVGHAFAHPLPGGRSVLYSVFGNDEASSRIEALDLETDEVKVITRGSYPRFSPTGHLLFVEAGGTTLLAAPFDLKKVELTGPAVPLVEGLLQHPTGYQFFALSETGRLVYRTGTTTTNGVTVSWVDRDGSFRDVDPEWLVPFGQNSTSLQLSPDDTRLAVSARGAEGTVDIYIKQLDDGPLTRLTFEGTVNRWPAWSPDGQSITFVSNRAGQDDLWTRRADGSGRAELVLDLDDPIKEALYSPDGEWLLFVVGEGNFGGGIYGVRLGQDSEPVPLVASDQWGALEMSLSPDGRWLAYASNRLGNDPQADAWQVWVQPFPDVDSGLWQVSRARADEPIWAHSGREIFFNTGPVGGQTLSVVDVSLEPTFAVGAERELFPLNLSGFVNPNGHEAKLSRDDQRFLQFREVRPEGNQLIVVDNFFEELKRMGN